jgi:hypothetical protein
MKKTYEVCVSEKRNKIFKVEARDAKEAEELVEHAIEQGVYDMTEAVVDGRFCFAEDHPDDPDKFGSFKVFLSVDFKEWYDSCVLRANKGDHLAVALNDAKEKMINGEFNFGFLKDFNVYISVSDDCGDDFGEEALFRETVANKRRFLANFRDAIDITLANWPEETEGENE